MVNPDRVLAVLLAFVGTLLLHSATYQVAVVDGALSVTVSYCYLFFEDSE